MTIFVDVNAPRDGNGTKEAPFKRLNDAASFARPGDEVLAAPGIYREYVNPIHAGTAEMPIVYRSLEPLRAVITGAEEAKGWQRYQGSVWTLRVSNGIFGAYNPYTTIVMGDWYFAPPIRHTGAVYLNDKMLYETETLEECVKAEVYLPSWEPEFSVYKWFSMQDGNDTVLYANFHDYDPNRENVEINVRRNCFFPEKQGLDYITVSGFAVSKAATSWAPPAAFQDGMIGPHWSKGWIIEDCDISNSRCCGISLGKYFDPENDHYFTTKHVKSPTQMERDAVCRGQYHGWLKEKIGSHIVRRNNIHHCEQTGIVGRMGCVFSIIEDNHIHHINNMQQLGGAEISAIKLHAAIDVTIRRNHIHHATMGVWLDWQAQGARISQNLMHDNYMPDGAIKAEGSMMCQDIFVEVSHGPTLIDNNVLLSRAALRIATQGIACVHNLILGSFTAVGGGTDSTVSGKNQPRYTPYHIRHRTEVAGFMTILHGDNRFYNNIFIQNWPAGSTPRVDDFEGKPDNQEVGIAVFDDYPTYDAWISHFQIGEYANMRELAQYHFSYLPVWAEGNAYFDGARPWQHEKHKLVDDTHPVYVKLVDKGGELCLDTNVYDYIDAFRDSVITSVTLGKAFEPEQLFEEPDGTAITFNRDYLANHRGIAVLPGPFAAPEDAKKKLN